MAEENWKNIWEKKGHSASRTGNYSVADLFTADGFDGALGKISEASRNYIKTTVREKLGITAGDRILEVGCGAGAVLALLADLGASLSGVDFSAPHIEIARRALSAMDFQVAEAAKLPFGTAMFDGVFSNGVFLYFPDLQYARKAVEELMRVAKPSAAIFVLDNPDAATKEECIAARRAAGASLSPEHLYYPRDFFREIAGANGRNAVFSPQEMPDYGNAAFRYNVLLAPK